MCLQEEGLYCGIQDAAHVIDVREIGKERAQVGEFGIMWIVEP